MLTYALKLTRTPGEMVEADVDALRRSVSAIEMCTTSVRRRRTTYVNRIADGLGVTVEDWYPPDPPDGHWPGEATGEPEQGNDP